ncbi:hypothetical protein [Ruminococcus sp.]|uniref:hypothetical protein n=1 Tax=Ruminococcus sp. TaxID=41978 RepID=UPI0025EF702E|nr:hypothetical protein [Ruminococcus sp.]MBQ8966360.1 hypothetical protein [Ruminococcus sp.]
MKLKTNKRDIITTIILVISGVLGGVLVNVLEAYGVPVKVTAGILLALTLGANIFRRAYPRRYKE